MEGYLGVLEDLIKKLEARISALESANQPADSSSDPPPQPGDISYDPPPPDDSDEGVAKKRAKKSD